MHFVLNILFIFSLKRKDKAEVQSWGRVSEQTPTLTE